MFGRILFPTDFSLPSSQVLKSLGEFKQVGTREIVLLYVIKNPDIFSQSILPADYQVKAEEESQNLLKEYADSLAKEGFSVTSRVKTGSPPVGIVETAGEEKVDLILMCSHGRTMEQSLFLGSVTEAVIRYSTLPVLIEKFRFIQPPQETVLPKFARILYPTDFSASSQKALEYVKNLAGYGTREVLLGHVQDIRQIYPYLVEKLIEFNQIDQERLEKIAEQLTPLGMEVKILLEEGVPFVKIIDWAKQEQTGLIVIGAHGKSRIEEMLIGSVSAEVARKASIPVLVVK